MHQDGFFASFHTGQWIGLGVSVLFLGFLAYCFLLVEVRLWREVFTAIRRRDAWSPFLPEDDGTYAIARGRRWSVLRATRRGGAAGLCWRWGFLALNVFGDVVLVVAVVELVVKLRDAIAVASST